MKRNMPIIKKLNEEALATHIRTLNLKLEYPLPAHIKSHFSKQLKSSISSYVSLRNAPLSTCIKELNSNIYYPKINTSCLK